MKKLFTFMAAILMAGAAAAQVPNEMNYSVMVLNPKTGRVMQNKEVQLRLELRQGSANGQAVWAQDFTETTDQSGLCLLTLNLADNIDWGKGDYYMAMLVDGEETGAPKLTSVPYALQAKSLEGVITKEELVGTWVYIHKKYGDTRTYVFNEDGTGTYKYEGKDGEGSSFKWYYLPSGIVAIAEDADEYGTIDVDMMNIVKLDEQTILMGAESGRIFNRQK